MNEDGLLQCRQRLLQCGETRITGGPAALLALQGRMATWQQLGDQQAAAREAGVIYFIDRALGTIMADDLEPVREGLRDFEANLREKHPDATAFSALPHPQQIEALHAIEESDFFDRIRTLTIAGMFAHPSYGGNRDKAGWRLLHFDDRHVWTPPFGYYDEQYTRANRE